MHTYELPRTIPDVKMLLALAPEDWDQRSLEEVDFKSSKANGAIVRCPLAVQ